MASPSLHQRNFRKARNASMLSDFPTHHLGAVLTYGSKVIAVGYNSSKTNPIQKHYNTERGFDPNTKNNGMLHAEMACLVQTRDLDIDWSKVSIYIYREHKDGSYALAKPCPACQKALEERGIKKIYYTTEDVPFAKLNTDE